MPTQVQMFYQAQRRIAEINEQFMEFVRGGMTREELARNIERRPSLWSRFSGFLTTLPSGDRPAGPDLLPLVAADAATESCFCCGATWKVGQATHAGDCPFCGKTSGFECRP